MIFFSSLSLAAFFFFYLFWFLVKGNRPEGNRKARGKTEKRKREPPPYHIISFQVVQVLTHVPTLLPIFLACRSRKSPSQRSVCSSASGLVHSTCSIA